MESMYIVFEDFKFGRRKSMPIKDCIFLINPLLFGTIAVVFVLAFLLRDTRLSDLVIMLIIIAVLVISITSAIIMISLKMDKLNERVLAEVGVTLQRETLSEIVVSPSKNVFKDCVVTKKTETGEEYHRIMYRIEDNHLYFYAEKNGGEYGNLILLRGI